MQGISPRFGSVLLNLRHVSRDQKEKLLSELDKIAKDAWKQNDYPSKRDFVARFADIHEYGMGVFLTDSKKDTLTLSTNAIDQQVMTVAQQMNIPAAISETRSRDPEDKQYLLEFLRRFPAVPKT